MQHDAREKKNVKATKSWLLNTIEPALHSTLHAKLDHEARCMAACVTLVAEICSEPRPCFENAKSEHEVLKLFAFLGESVKVHHSRIVPSYG